MFYDQTTIDLLAKRVDWAPVILPSSILYAPFDDPPPSGRFFKDFNQLVIIENVYATVPNASISQNDFGIYMESLKVENVLDILSIIFDTEERANYRTCLYGNRIDISNIDYSSTLQTKAGLLDNLLGLGMAIKCCDLFLASSRANGDKRSAVFSFNTLMTDLHGLKDENGKTISQGLYAKFSIEKQKVLNILFPVLNPKYVIGRCVW